MPAAKKPASRQARRSSRREAEKAPGRKRPPTDSEAAAEEMVGTVELADDQPASDPPPNGVLLTREFADNGKIAVNVVTLGDVRASEIEYIIKRGAKAVADADL